MSPSTLYRWIGRGYAGMSNLDLRRKVGYKPRSKARPARRPANSKGGRDAHGRGADMFG